MNGLIVDTVKGKDTVHTVDFQALRTLPLLEISRTKISGRSREGESLEEFFPPPDFLLASEMLRLEVNVFYRWSTCSSLLLQEALSGRLLIL